MDETKGSDPMKKRIPYGIGDFESIRKDNMYYIDKTKIIEYLEMHQYPFFIRPRRFGKSLLISILEDYYDIEKKDTFDELFKGLWIHENPTEERNSYLVLRLDFSGIETDKGKKALFNSFLWKVKMKVGEFVNRYALYYKQKTSVAIENAESPSAIMEALCTQIKEKQIYLLIDEVDFLFPQKVQCSFDNSKLHYDNFANDLIGANEDNLYYDILSKTGFVRSCYEAIKSGAQEGAISRIFLTGVSPIMLDDLTSGFNIAKNITLNREYNTALGFTQKEVEKMLDYYNILPEEKKKTALEDMKQYYNGYLFHPKEEERLYNPDIVLHFMDSFKEGRYPDVMLDMNVWTFDLFQKSNEVSAKRNFTKTHDYSKIQRLINEDRLQEESKIEQILKKKRSS